MRIVGSFVGSLRAALRRGNVFVCCIFNGVIYYVAGFVSWLLRCGVVGVVKEMLECLQAFPCCCFHTFTEFFLSGIVFEFVCAVGCARCWGHANVLLV